MFTLWSFLLLVTVTLGMNQSTIARSGNGSSLKSDLDLIPIDIYIRLTEIAEFSNEAIRMLDFPWLVSIQNQDGSHLCSANILTGLHVLTTCQCLIVPTGSVITPFRPRRPEDIFIVAGVSRLNLPLRMLMSKGQVRDVEEIHIHPRCSPFQKFDFAVAELDHFLYFTPYIRPMPGMLYDRMNGLPRFCRAAGWRQSLPGWDRPDPYYEDMVVNDYIIQQNDECPEMSEPQEGAQFVCAQVFPMKPVPFSLDGLGGTSGPSGDHGSGLLCNERVIAILSHHNENRMTSVFTSLGPAMSFLSPFFADLVDPSLTASSSSFPAISFPVLSLIGLLSVVYQRLMFQTP